MDNLFEEAKFGRHFQTKDGRDAIYLGKNFGYCCAIQKDTGFEIKTYDPYEFWLNFYIKDDKYIIPTKKVEFKSKIMKKIINFFKKVDEVKDKRFKDFDDLYTELIKEFPISLRKELKDNPKLKPCEKKKYQDYVLGFNATDVLWWREKYKEERFLVKPVEDIRKLINEACLDVIDNLDLKETDKDIEDIYKSILDDSL